MANRIALSPVRNLPRGETPVRRIRLDGKETGFVVLGDSLTGYRVETSPRTYGWRASFTKLHRIREELHRLLADGYEPKTSLIYVMEQGTTSRMKFEQ